MSEQITIGKCYTLIGYGQCIVTYRNSRGFWVEVRGGISGDKTSVIKGISADRLAEIVKK